MVCLNTHQKVHIITCALALMRSRANKASLRDTQLECWKAHISNLDGIAAVTLCVLLDSVAHKVQLFGGLGACWPTWTAYICMQKHMTC